VVETKKWGLVESLQVTGGVPLKRTVNLYLFLFLLLSGHEMSSSALPDTPDMMCCLTTGLKAMTATDYSLKPLTVSLNVLSMHRSWVNLQNLKPKNCESNFFLSKLIISGIC
jgi:hypothetical protein